MEGAQSRQKERPMYTGQEVVHGAEVGRYRPGHEEGTLRVVSSERSDAGQFAVIDEPQYATSVDSGYAARLPALLLACLRGLPAPLARRLVGWYRARPGDVRPEVRHYPLVK